MLEALDEAGEDDDHPGDDFEDDEDLFILGGIDAGKAIQDHGSGSTLPGTRIAMSEEEQFKRCSGYVSTWAEKSQSTCRHAEWDRVLTEEQFPTE